MSHGYAQFRKKVYGWLPIGLGHMCYATAPVQPPCCIAFQGERLSLMNKVSPSNNHKKFVFFLASNDHWANKSSRWDPFGVKIGGNPGSWSSRRVNVRDAATIPIKYGRRKIGTKYVQIGNTSLMHNPPVILINTIAKTYPFFVAFHIDTHPSELRVY